MSYWSNKEKMAERAVLHTKKMEDKYQIEIQWCINNTKCFTDKVDDYKNFKCLNNTIIMEDTDTVSSIFNHCNEGVVAALNFASYKNAGGCFLGGSTAQEECLCHASYLYNVLRECNSYYEYNNAHKNNALYTNRALYTESVRFFNNQKSVCCDVITCAAPNYYSAYKYRKMDKDSNSIALKQRIKFVLDVAEYNKVDTLILGAFGCGVFGQDPREVATIFKEELASHNFNKIIFAIPSGHNDNYYWFNETLKG